MTRFQHIHSPYYYYYCEIFNEEEVDNMKFNAIKENMTLGLNIVQRALSSKSVQPILNGIYLSAKDGHLTMVATDTIENAGLRIQCTVPVEVIEEGDTVVSGKAFRDFVMRLPDTNLQFENTSRNGQDRMTISYGKNKTEMLGWPGYDFPKPPAMDILHVMRISNATLSDLVRQTSFAARKEDLRPIFTGLLFEVNGDDLTVVGTDSFRLAMMQDKVQNDGADSFQVVIPVKALAEVIAICEEDAIIHISVTKNQILFEAGGVQLTSQLIQGEFPPYRAALPKTHTTHFDIDRTTLKQSIDRAILFGRDRDGTSVIHVDVHSGNLSIKTASEMGQVDEELDIYMEGDDVHILFNANFLTDALTKMHYDALDVEMSGDLGPCVFRPKNDENYTYLLLPLRQ
ncbi:MAG: DNA polymerase III subunit beta [Peptococcaceae bacterium]|nr:DNA polymerase III subunit beta [Peptococcaceae bacterium]